MEARLEVELTAKIDGLRDAFNEATRQAGKYDKDTRAKLTAIDKGFVELANHVDGSMKKTSNSIRVSSSAITKELAGVAAASAKTGTAVAKSSRDWTGLSRVIQDLPFGFMGIQNNITQLLPAAGGLGLALSVVTSAITFATTGTDYWTRGLEDNSKALKDAKNNLDAYIESLDDVTEISLKGTKAAQDDIAVLRTLYAVANDVTASTMKRKEAVDELQKQFPAYFKNIKDINIQNGSSIEIYNKLTESILATAKAEAARSKISENSKRILDDEQRMADLAVERAKVEEARDRAFKNRKSDLSYMTNTYLPTQRELKKIDEETAALDKDKWILNERNYKLEERFVTLAKEGAKISSEDGAGARTKDVKTLADVMKELNTNLKIADQQFQKTFDERSKIKIDDYQKAINDLVRIGIDPASEAFKRLKAEQQALFQLQPGDVVAIPMAERKKIGLQGKANLTPGQFTPEQIALLKQQQEFNDTFADLATNGLASGLSGIGTAIGEAMVNGGNVLEAVGSSLLDGFSSFLSEFGELLIAYGAAAVLKSKLDLAAFIPGAGIAAGLAAIGAGIALVAAAGAVNALGKGRTSNDSQSYTVGNARKFANGGIVSGPTLGLMGEYAGASSNPEVVAPLDRLNDLIGASIQRAMSVSPMGSGFNSAYGFSGGGISVSGGRRNEPIIIIPESRLEGSTIVTAYRRANNNRV